MVLTTYVTATTSDDPLVSIKYNPQARAGAKAYFNALIHCQSISGDDADDFVAYWAVRGKWGGDDKDGKDDTGDALHDHFIAYLRGGMEDDVECYEGELIKEAFDYYSKIAGSKPWNSWELEDKQELFCGTSDGYSNGFVLSKFDQSGTDPQENCRNVVKIVSEASWDDEIGDHYFEGNNYKKGREYLAKYINEKIFKGEFRVDEEYTEDEMFYVYSGLMRNYCAKSWSTRESITSAEESELYSVFYFEFPEDGSITLHKTWAKRDHEEKTGEYRMFKSSDYTTDHRNRECKKSVWDVVRAEPSKNEIRAAAASWVNYGADGCWREYQQNFYEVQKKYYNSLSEEQKAGEKAEYVKWFEALPKEPNSADTCFSTNVCKKDVDWLANPHVDWPKDEVWAEKGWQDRPVFECKVEEYIKELMDTNPDPDSPSYGGYTPGGPSGGGGDDATTPVTCANSGGAGSLGWIVCPILDWMGRASEKLYNNYVEPALNIRASLFKEDPGDDNNDVKDAWGTFRDIANLAFIILFLIVIFSQLTGVGIDNYGIKKILPKLIIVVVLVNLSYFICLICVDLSNIVGNGVQSLFDGLGSSLSMNFGEYGSSVGDEVKSTALTAVPILAALLVAGVAIWENPAILLTLLVSALGVVISVFFLFILLSARQAAVVVLTVLSPLAFVCYALPNTKKLFDKWLNISKGLLLVYPICGLLVGGGGYVSKLLMVAGMGDPNKGGFVNAFSAMMISIVPIFFIPSVLKGSFAALGNLGAKISGFGEKLRGGATRGLRNTAGYKNAQRMGLERRTRLKAGLDKNGNLTKRGERRTKRANSGIGRFFGSDKRRAAYLAQAKKDIGTSEEARASLSGALARTGISGADEISDLGFAQGSESAYYAKQFLDAANKGNATDLNAAVVAMRSSGMKAKDIAKVIRYAESSGKFGGKFAKDPTAKAAWMRDMAKKYGNDFLATDFELNHFMTAGGGGNLGSKYGDYASSGAFGLEDVKPEDILKLSGDSLAGMISSGKIDQGMAQRVMAMNPNMSADKRIMLGALASGAVGAGVDVGQFKNDATTLAGNRNATVSTITSSGSDSLATLVGRWTAPTAQRTTVVQEFFGEEDGQIRPVDVSIVHGDAGSGGGTGGGDVGGITAGGGAGGVGTGGAGGGVPQGDLMGVHDDFSGETHVNSGTGKIRTYDRMDMYPRMKGESSEAYGARLKMMREKEEEFIRSQNGNRG